MIHTALYRVQKPTSVCAAPRQRQSSARLRLITPRRRDGTIGRVDIRIKTFPAEAQDHFGYLLTAGFSTPLVERIDSGRTQITVTYLGPGQRVETWLLLSYGGEEEVGTSLETTSRRREFGPQTAHSGHQMRKALQDQAAAVHKSINHPVA